MGMAMTAARGVALLMLVIGLGACTTTNEMSARDFVLPKKDARILILQPTADMALITAGGVREARADWTQTAKSNLVTSFEKALGAKNVNVVMQPASDEMDGQLLMLSETVMVNALTYGPQMGALTLPTKEDTFDWTLGKAVAPLADAYDADYAMFVYSYGNFASAANLTLQWTIAILSQGAYLPSGGAKSTLISLVDLKDGDLVWIDQYASGDVRDPVAAGTVVERLVERLPVEGTRTAPKPVEAKKSVAPKAPAVPAEAPVEAPGA